MASALTLALQADDMDTGVRIVMTALGVTTGDVAGMVLDDDDRRRWASQRPHDRVGILERWLVAELDAATEENVIDGAAQEREPVKPAHMRLGSLHRAENGGDDDPGID